MPSENQQVLRLRQTYLMRRFLLIALGMGFLLPTAVNADLGEAERLKQQIRSYKVWCGEKFNNCTVTFDRERMRVDGGKGITPDQIIEMNGRVSNSGSFTYFYTITYRNENGENIESVFLMANAKTVNNFKEELKKFTVRKY